MESLPLRWYTLVSFGITKNTNYNYKYSYSYKYSYRYNISYSNNTNTKTKRKTYIESIILSVGGDGSGFAGKSFRPTRRKSRFIDIFFIFLFYFCEDKAAEKDLANFDLSCRQCLQTTSCDRCFVLLRILIVPGNETSPNSDL